MTTFRIGTVEFDLQPLGSGIRFGVLPPRPPQSNWDLTLKESQDLEAFEAAGWNLRPGEEFDWNEVRRLNDGPGEIGVLVRRKPWGGLAIVRDRIVVAVQPGVDFMPSPPDFIDVRPIAFTSSKYDARIPNPAPDLLSALQIRVVFLSDAFDGGVNAEPLLVEHYVNSGQGVSVATPPVTMDLLQWHWNRINLGDAWTAGSKGAQPTNNKPTRVAVIDFGFDLNEPQLQGQYTSWAYVDDTGQPFAGSRQMPNQVHGTLCAGLIGAKLDGISVNGAAPDAKLTYIAVQSVSTQLALSAALRLCINGPNGNDGADVVSGSIGTNT